MWENNQIIKKIIQVDLNKSNNFTVDLNTLGLGTWQKGKVDYYVCVEHINLMKSGGYILELKDIGSTHPVYQLHPKKIVGDTVNERLLFKTTNPYPQTNVISLSEDCFMYRIYAQGTPSRGDSITLYSKSNGANLYQIKGYDTTTITKIYTKDRGVPTKIEGGWTGKQRIESYYEYSIYEYTYSTITDTDSRFKVIFIEKE